MKEKKCLPIWVKIPLIQLLIQFFSFPFFMFIAPIFPYWDYSFLIIQTVILALIPTFYRYVMKRDFSKRLFIVLTVFPIFTARPVDRGSIIAIAFIAHSLA
jgi:hypothetical protein